MIVRATSLLPGALVLVLASFIAGIAGCSSDDGKPEGGTGGTTTPLPTATVQPDAAVASTAKKKSIESCTQNDECESNVCFQGDQGAYCSFECTAATAATACVAPFAGTCNKKGFCRKP